MEVDKMKTMKCPRINEDVRIDITEKNCIALHEWLDDDACPLEGCFAHEKIGSRDNETYDASNAKCKFGDIA